MQEMWVQYWIWKIPCKRAWQSTPVFLPGESHGQRSLAGYSPKGCKESDMTQVTEDACTHASGAGVRVQGKKGHSMHVCIIELMIIM